MIKIYDINGNILFQDNDFSLKEIVEKNKFDLRYANLRSVNLSGSDLKGGR